MTEWLKVKKKLPKTNTRKINIFNMNMIRVSKKKLKLFIINDSKFTKLCLVLYTARSEEHLVRIELTNNNLLA